MAGNYPDVPSWRMAIDVDGTQIYGLDHNFNPVIAFTSEMLVRANADNSATPEAWSIITGNGVYYYVAAIFPEIRDLDGWFVCTGTNTNQHLQKSYQLQVSTNSTNGVDGTWTSMGDHGAGQATGGGLRNSIVASTVLGIKAVRVRVQGNSFEINPFRRLHLYGEPAPGENLQRLEIWHPTLDQRIGPAYLDWGDVPRNSTDIRDFRIKNMHPTLTANSVRAAMSILTDTTPSVVGQHSISKDGGTSWAAQQTLSSSLGPGAVSPVLKIRRTTPSNAVLSLWWCRLFADCTSWT